MNLLFSARSKAQENTDYLPLEEQGISAKLECTPGDGSVEKPYVVNITLKNGNPQAWEGVIHMELAVPKAEPKFFLPAFMYGRNRGESPKDVLCEFPRIREGEADRPASSWWMVRGDRLSHPAAFIYDSGKVYGFHASPFIIEKNGKKRQWCPADGSYNSDFTISQYAGYSCNINKQPEKTTFGMELRSEKASEYCTVGYTLGYEDAPWKFIQSHNVKERQPLSNNCVRFLAGESISLEMTVYAYDVEGETGINEAVKAVYETYHQSPRSGSMIKDAVSDLATAVYRDAWLPKEKCYSGFVYDRTGEFTYNKLGSLTWTNGLSVAVPILIAGIRLKNDEMRRQALFCIQNMIEHCMNPDSGFPYDACSDGKWSIKGWWFDRMHTPGHASYLMGQAIYYILRAYYYEKMYAGCEHIEFLRFVEPVLDRMERAKNTDDEYPYIFSAKTGAGLEYDSFGGAWCFAAIAYYSFITGKENYLESLKRSEKHYYEEFVAKMECYGAPLDAEKAVDSEGVLAYLRGIHYLHRLTGAEIYLRHMKDALDYEFTFKFCYNVPIAVPPLSKIGWSSCGGSVTSTANPHIHPMSSTVVDEILYYAEQTKDAYVMERLKDVIRWGCQTYNTYDGEYDYGKKGWMSERFCYSEGLLAEKYEDGSPASTWFCLMSWACGSILEGLTGDIFTRGSKDNE